MKKRRLFISLIISATAIVCMHACMSFRMSQQEVDEYFSKHHVTGTQACYHTGAREVHYVKAGNETKPLVVFIHGSPGSLSAFISYLTDSTLLQNTLLISTDRPGYGYSNFGNAEPSLKKQAAILKPLLEQYKNNRPIILVGHSLGGPVVARMAMDYPDLVNGLIIVAGSIDPELEPNETWFRAPLATPFLSWILPRAWRVTNEEIYQLKPQLEEMEPLWSRVTCPVIVIQGTTDSLVPAGNAAFAKKVLTNAPVELYMKENIDHFIPWSNPEFIKEAIEHMLTTHRISQVNHTNAGQ